MDRRFNLEQYLKHRFHHHVGAPSSIRLEETSKFRLLDIKVSVL